MDVYVIRIYRYPDDCGGEMLGFVESIGESDDTISQFTTTDELLDILTSSYNRQHHLVPEQAIPGKDDDALVAVDRHIEELRRHPHKLPERCP